MVQGGDSNQKVVSYQKLDGHFHIYLLRELQCFEKTKMNEKVAGVGPFKKHFHTFSLPSVAVKKKFYIFVPRWWHDLANSEELHCRQPTDWSLKSFKFPNLFSRSFPVKSFPCSNGDRSIEFTFEGDIVEGTFDGFGHLEIDPYTMAPSSGICLEVNRVYGGDALVKVSGHFADGVLHGEGRLVFESGAVVAAGFDQGLFHGFRRDWSSNGDLIFAGFYENGARVGRCWSKVGRSLVFQDCSTVNRSDESSIVIPLDDMKTVLVGDFYRNVGSVDGVKEADLIEAKVDGGGCLMNVTVKIGSSDLDYFYDIVHDEAIPKSAHMDKPMCSLGQYRGL